MKDDFHKAIILSRLMIATAALVTIAALVFAWMSKSSLRTTDVERAKGPSLEVQP